MSSDYEIRYLGVASATSTLWRHVVTFQEISNRLRHSIIVFREAAVISPICHLGPKAVNSDGEWVSRQGPLVFQEPRAMWHARIWYVDCILKHRRAILQHAAARFAVNNNYQLGNIRVRWSTERNPWIKSLQATPKFLYKMVKYL